LVLATLSFNGTINQSHRGISTGVIGGIIGGGILLVIFLIIMGNLLPVGLGTYANGSAVGTKMVNVDSGTKGLYNNVPIIVIITLIVLVVAVMLSALHKSGKI